MTESSTAAAVSSWDVDEVRANFPILLRPFESGKYRKGTLPVFLDSAASAQKPRCVIDKEREVEETYYANAYRGVYEFGARVDEELEASRAKVANLIGAASSEEVAFTAGTTMSINLLARGWGGKFLGPGDEVLISEMEHHANIVPWQMICAERGATLRWLPITEDRRLDLNQLDEYLTRRTKMVSITGMSNVLGTINPIAEIARRAHDVGALMHVDAAQSVPHQPVSVINDGIDFLSLSGHKLFGPSGVGAFYGRRELLDDMNPFMGGGHMIAQVFKSHSTYSDPPAKFEAGTLPIVQAIALGTAIDYVTGLGFDRIHAYESQLLAYAHEGLGSIPGLTIHGPSIEHKGAICAFTIEGASSYDLAEWLNSKGVFVRHGHHCTMPLHQILKIENSVRASFAFYNTREEIDRLVNAIDFTVAKLR